MDRLACILMSMALLAAAAVSCGKDAGPEGGIGERIRTDGYNCVSLVGCTAGILLAGILSGLYGYIGSVGF